MDETERIEQQFQESCMELRISATNRDFLKTTLLPLRNKDAVTHFHYLHSLRVALLAQAIGHFTHHEEKPLFFAGALHDLGKCQIPHKILGKKGGWNDIDQQEIERHVEDGHRLLRGRFDISAEIMLWHHRFQEDGYPSKLPPFLHQYRETTKLLIREYGRILALADVYDALHRDDAKFGITRPLTGEEIRQKMFELNPDRKKLVAALYNAHIFSTQGPGR